MSKHDSRVVRDSVIWGRMSHTISSAVPALIAFAAHKEGHDPALVLGPEAPAAPPRPDEHVAVSQYYDVWRRALALTNDASFPLRVASTFQLEDHEVFGFLAMTCETLGQAYEKTATYRALYCVGARWELSADPEAARLVWFPWPGDASDTGVRAAMEFAVADMADAITRLGVARPKPIAVHLAHPAPDDTAPFRNFYGVEPKYGASQYALVYDAELPAQPISSFNSRLRDYFDDECRRLVAVSASGQNIVDQVRKCLIHAMDGGDTSIEAIAKQLGLSGRSLQRRLAEEGTRYNDVLGSVREEFAKRYLARGTVSASEVAYLLGFTEPPAFFKAFKRWTGMTPREFQLEALGGVA